MVKTGRIKIISANYDTEVTYSTHIGSTVENVFGQYSSVALLLSND